MASKLSVYRQKRDEIRGEKLKGRWHLVWLDGQDLQGRPPEERRDLLESVLANAPDTFVRTASKTRKCAKITRWSSNRGAG